MKTEGKRNKLSGPIAACFAVALIYGVMFLLGFGCPIKLLTGISCAGCGMTRAWLSLFTGDIATAFSYHPLFPVPALWLAVFICYKKQLLISEKLYKIINIVCIVAFLAVYIIRLADPADPIVVIHPEDGLIIKTIRFILN